MRRILAAIALIATFATGPALAQELMASYSALLSERDHFNSNGQRLTSAAAIIRQDRANYHRFGRRDNADQWDPIFGSVDARARMEALLNRGTSAPSAIQAIVNGTPYVTVEVWGYRGVIDFVNVTVN
ncbi:MAG: hypothetical protein ACFCVH_14055 [Alphaproteobacteria bacterium]